MNVIIRTDASVKIGSGHVMRCLTVAKKLRSEGCLVKFWMEELDGNLIDFVVSEGFENITEAQYGDLYIVDHYGLDIEWERMIRKYTKKLVVIDDLAREHDCDLLIDQNLFENYKERYNNRVPSSCVTLLGPEYLILRDEFITARKANKKAIEKVSKILVFMGGTDPTSETLKVLSALEAFSFEEVHVVCGKGNIEKEIIQEICRKRQYIYHEQINYMAELMNQVDFLIGAGGSTTWERCYVGLPSSSTIVAENQLEGTELLGRYGAVKNLGWHEKITVETYKKLLKDIQTNLDELNYIKQVGIKLTGNDDSPHKWLEKILELGK